VFEAFRIVQLAGTDDVARALDSFTDEQRRECNALLMTLPFGRLLTGAREARAAYDEQQERIASLTAELSTAKSELAEAIESRDSWTMLFGRVSSESMAGERREAELAAERDALLSTERGLVDEVRALVAERDVLKDKLDRAESARDLAVEKLGETRADLLIVRDGFFEATNRASLTLKRAESAEQALRALRDAASQYIEYHGHDTLCGYEGRRCKCGHDELSDALADAAPKETESDGEYS